MEELLKDIASKLDMILAQEKQVFTVQEAAKFLGMSPTNFRGFVKIGQVRFAANGNVKLFRREWLLEFMEKNADQEKKKILHPKFGRKRKEVLS